jgi:hypothetical protein
VREHHKDDGSLGRSNFASFARWIEEQLGRSTAFVLAVALWAVTGPFLAGRILGSSSSIQAPRS